MAYNKAKEEKKWLLWKEAEEKQLRDLGVEEDTIQRLRQYDWDRFKAERNYNRWNISTDVLPEKCETDEEPKPIVTAQNLLDEIDSEPLLAALQTLDTLTLQILLYKISGYSGKEISRCTGLSEAAISNRLTRLRKKLKKFF